MALRPVETPQHHVRRALQLLEELEDDLRVPSCRMPTRDDHVGLLVAARRRLWLAVAALPLPPDPPRPLVRLGRLARHCAVQGMLLLALAGWVARAVAFVLRFFWRSMRVALRLVYTLRAL